MIIRKEFEKYNKSNWEDGYVYIIKYNCNKGYIFINNKNIKEKDIAFINILNLVDIDFLEEHNIDYIFDKDNKIIPVGIVNFINNNENEQKYNSMSLKLMCDDEEKLYRCNEIMEYIDKAIQIKYEAVKFVEKVGSSQEIELV